MFSNKAAIFSLSPVTQTNIESKWTFVKYLKIALFFTSIHCCLLAWLSSRSKTILIPLKSRQNSHFKGWHYILFASSANVIGADTIQEEGRYIMPRTILMGNMPFQIQKRLKKVKFYPNIVHWKKLLFIWFPTKSSAPIHSDRVTHGIPSDKLPQQ